MNLPVPVERIEQSIHILRGHRVMLDTDLAELYGVEVKQLKRQVRRNRDRFPSDFLLELSHEEYRALRCQIGSLKRGEHAKYRPFAFTEQGVAMLSSVLKSKRAIQVNIAIMRAFVQLREMIASNKGLARRLNELEKKYDAQFRVVFEAIRELMEEPEPKSRRIGFKT
ncbi:MAG: ORF6N domain-containing protein [Nitrospira sp.]